MRDSVVPKGKKIFFVSSSILILSFFIVYTLFSAKNISSPELLLSSISPYGENSGKAVAASCGFTIHGSADETSACTTNITCAGVNVSKAGTSQCGGVCNPNDIICPNGACSNGAINPPTCNTCSANQTMINGQCRQNCRVDLCGDGTTYAGTMDANGQCQLAANTGPSRCSVRNACNQLFNGYQCSNGCSAGKDVADINSSCFNSFTVTSNTVNPNGSVEFAWSLNLPEGVGSRCGFVDLTTPTPRPIPGLQNLDPTTDRLRISNVQTTTRFCLVCQFYNLINNAQFGEAAVHQWVRVLRIGEQ